MILTKHSWHNPDSRVEAIAYFYVMECISLEILIKVAGLLTSVEGSPHKSA